MTSSYLLLREKEFGNEYKQQNVYQQLILNFTKD